MVVSGLWKSKGKGEKQIPSLRSESVTFCFLSFLKYL